MPSAPARGYRLLVLGPDTQSADALEAILSAHLRLLDWLDVSVPADHPADLVALHRNFYDAAQR